MHETGLSEAIVEATLRRARGRQVVGLRARIGGHVVDADVVTQGILLAALGTNAEGAAVDLVCEPMTARCRSCGRGGPVDDHMAMVACTRCGALDIELTGHDQVVLESITVHTGGSA